MRIFCIRHLEYDIYCTICSPIVEPDQILNVYHWYVALLTEKHSPILLLVEGAQFGLFPMETSFSLLVSHKKCTQ